MMDESAFLQYLKIYFELPAQLLSFFEHFLVGLDLGPDQDFRLEAVGQGLVQALLLEATRRWNRVVVRWRFRTWRSENKLWN